jgi:hypothetical protein
LILHGTPLWRRPGMHELATKNNLPVLDSDEEHDEPVPALIGNANQDEEGNKDEEIYDIEDHLFMVGRAIQTLHETISFTVNRRDISY